MTTAEYRNKKILLVEDDLHVRNCLESMLEFDGHKVQAVETGDEALAMLDHEKFDLVVTDYWMPQLKGDELAQLIKQRHPNLPIILASGSLDSLSTFHSSSPGVDCLLNKPFTMAELQEAIIWALALHADSDLVGPEFVGILGGNPDKPDISSRPREDWNNLR